MIIAPSALTWIDVVQILVIPVLLPALVGLATRWEPVGNLPTLGKRLILAGLALASQLLTDLIQSAANGTAYDLYGALFLGAVAILAAQLTYLGYYKAQVTTASDATLASTLGGQK